MPPASWSTSVPGLFTSNDLMTIIWGADTKSRTGTGIFLTRYSHTTSVLYLFGGGRGEVQTPRRDSAILPSPHPTPPAPPRPVQGEGV